MSPDAADADVIDVVILCGGRGTRAYPDTAELPKPLLEVGGKPILDHVMDIYAGQHRCRFILAAGYRADLIIERYESGTAERDILVVDTGLDTGTGERIRRAAEAVRGDRFLATYGDGLGDVDMAALTACHEMAGGLATVTTVPLRSQYGTLVSTTGGKIVEFREKPILHDHWINAGFFVFERDALSHWRGESLEQDVLPQLARRDVLYGYRHVGFWKSMDTFKDRQELEVLAGSDPLPWSVGSFSAR